MAVEKKIVESFNRLKEYCEQENFKGWDPYDGLNSKWVSLTPFNYFKIGRLAWIQFFKRSKINLRKLFLIEKNHNPKALGLFISGYCNLYQNDPKEAYLEKLNYLKNKLFELKTPGFSGDCWGYSFPWQSRVFYQKRYAPTVVATSFISNALLDLYEITKEKKLLDSAISTTRFILSDLNKTQGENGTFIFSYSPSDETKVFNASLLAARQLIRVYHYTKEERLLIHAKKAVEFVCNEQNKNGSWRYGLADIQYWIDSFHTGYNLESIADYQKYSGDTQFDSHLKKGVDYYVKHFFTEEGISKYYHDKLWPVDIHAPTQLIITLTKMNLYKEYQPIIKKVLDWTLDNMQDKNGYFYYRLQQGKINKIPYMRWAQAWMFLALTYRINEGSE